MVEFNNPVVECGDLVQPVDMTWGRGTSVRKPCQFRGVKEGGDHQLVLDARVVAVPVVDGVLELQNRAGDS